MLTTAETTASAATAAASNATAEAADGEAFARELGSRLNSAVTASQEAIEKAMSKLASAFPSTTLTQETFGSFQDTAAFMLTVDSATTIVLSPEMMASVAEDDDAFERVKAMIGNLFSAGEQQNLAKTNGSVTNRSVVIDSLTTKFVEVQRDEKGRATSLMSLALETQKLMADALDRMLGINNSNNNNNRANGFASSFFAQGGIMNPSNNASSTSASGVGGMFGSMTMSSSTWQVEGFFTRDTAAEQQLQSSQNTLTSLEVIIKQWEIETEITGSSVDLFSYMQIMGLCDPLVFDLGDEGINLTSVEDGVYFDIKGDGSPVQTAWISGNNAFLYLDENGNGVADDGNELFGDHGGYANGFDKLAQYDDNGDGVIDENDEVYSQLRLWRDLNGDGVNQASESLTLADAGIKSINLNYNDTRTLDRHGNVIGEQSSFTRYNGSEGLVADAWFRTKK